MVVHQNENIRITFDEEKKRLVQEWNGFAPSGVFREAIDQTVDFIKKNNVTTVLSDALNQSVVNSEDAEYAASVLPTMARNGMKAMAFVVPENVFAQFALDKFSKNVEGAPTQYFKSIKKAEQWLDEYSGSN